MRVIYAADGVTQATINDKGDAVVKASDFNALHAQYRAMKRALVAMRQVVGHFSPSDAEVEERLRAACEKADAILCPDPAGERIRLNRRGDPTMAEVVLQLATTIADSSFGPTGSDDASLFWQFEEASLLEFTKMVRQLDLPATASTKA